ncbi:MAG TPA: cytochrome c-type biogenesis protein CcmH [Candidatus Polarisedimenticolaceae bacterium]|nr:cytochrome c-type biogenesis protein CcmH [Candidatus Polarisedimenticolaceae bacterium]
MPERRARALLLALALWAPVQAAGEIPPGVDEKAYLEVATTVLCDCGCHPQSVHACACGVAAQRREEIAAALMHGGPGGTPQSSAQVIAAWVAKYGEKIRIAPTKRGFNLVAWLGPSCALLAAGVALSLALRRWRGRGEPEPVAAGVPADLDPSYLQRLRRELGEER